MRTWQWMTTVLAATALVAGCGEGERAAPPTSALALPESLRVAGHEHRCPDAEDAPCTRTLLVAPALEAEKPLATGAQLRDELRPALRAEGWSVTDGDDAFTTTSADGEATALILLPARDQLAGTQLENQLRSMVDDGQPVLVVYLGGDAE